MDEPFKPSDPKLPSLGLSAFLLAGFGILGFMAWSSWRSHVLSENHRFAATARLELVRAQSNYIRQKNGAVPLGTQDAAGLYPLGLIDRSLAEADDRPLQALVPTPIPANGYYVRFLPMDVTQEVDGKVVHHPSFGYCLHPAKPGVTGNYIFLLGDGGLFRRCAVGVRPVPTVWPSDKEIQTYWSNDCGG